MLDSIKSLFSLIREKKLQIDGLSLLKPKDAIEILQKAESLNCKLLGIDSFKLFNNKKVQPVQDFSTDVKFYSELSIEQFYDYNINLVKKGALQGLLFEVWIDKNKKFSEK